MKKRVIWKMFLLTIVTLGIYRLYWFVKTRREMMNLNPDVKILTPLLLFIPVVLVAVSIGAFVFSLVNTISNQPSYCHNSSVYSQADDSNPIRGVPAECQSTAPGWGIGLIYLSIFLFYPLMVVWLWGYSKGVEIITNAHTSFAIALIIFLLVPDGIDILIVQDSFNKLAVPSGTNHSGAPTPVAA